MHTMFLKKLTSPVRFFAAGTCAALFAALTLCLSAAPAHGVSQPSRIVASGASTQIGIMKFTPTGGSSSGGGWDGGQDPLGGTFVIGANGDVIVGDGYTGNVDVFEITPSGNQIELAVGVKGNSNAAAMDQYGNVYIAFDYSGAEIVKLPYNSVTGTYAGYTTAPSANCQGGTLDTTACLYATQLSSLSPGGIEALAFDGRGNLIVGISPTGALKNNIYVCSVACQTGSASPQLLYADSNNIGAVAADPWGNIFFVDGGNNGSSSGKVSNLKEIQLSSGTYGSPSVIESYTTLAAYNGLSGVAVGADGTVYFETNNDGIFGIPNSSSGLNLSGLYVVSNSAGGSAIAVDSHGNFAFIGYNNTLSENVIDYMPTGSFQLGAVAVNPATPATASATIIDSAAACTPTLTLKATQFGVASTDYSVTAGTSCAAALGTSNGTFAPAIVSTGGAVMTASISFSPPAVGVRNGVLTVTDSTNNAMGTVALSGTGQGGLGTVDPGNIASSITTGLTNPVDAVVDPAGDLFVADASGKVYELAAGGTTLTTIGSGFVSPSALAFDANGNLYVADNGTGADDVVEIPNTGTAGAFTAGTQVTVIGSTMPIAGQTLQNPTGLAVGPDGTLYIADGTEARVVAYNPATGQGGLTAAVGASGLKTPQGIAVDGSGNLYVADPGAQEVFIFSPAGVESTLSNVAGITDPVGVAVEASGSVLIADSTAGNIVRVPSISGAAPDPTKAVTIDTVAPSASSLAMNDSGHHIVVASGSGKAVYNIQRTAGAINLGAVQDGATNTGTIYLENAGNAVAILASPDVTQPSTDTWITLQPGTTNGCAAGGSGGPAGSFCTFLAQFAPPAGTATGPYSDTGDILLSSPAASIPVTISGNATASAAQANTITWNAGTPSAGYVGQQAVLTATATSGLPVTLASTTSTVCTLSGATSPATVSYIGTGTCTVTASQPQCANTCSNNSTLYGAATPAPINIAITSVTATGVPSLLVTQATWIGDLSGGFFSGDNPSGGTFAVNSVGNAIVADTYGNNIEIWAAPSVANSTGYPETWTDTAVSAKVLFTYGGAAGASVDASNNIYVADLYGTQIGKIPYVNGAYVTTATSPAPNCAGGTADTTPCVFSVTGLSHSESGLAATAIDANGNLFIVSAGTIYNGSTVFTGQNGIYMVSAANLATVTSGSVAATPVYTSDLDTVAAIGLDSADNLFFTDSQLGATPGGTPTNPGSDEAYASNLYEVADTGKANAPTYSNVAVGQTGGPVLLQSYTDSSAGAYDNVMSGLAVDQKNGVVYFSTKSDGIWAFADNGTPFTATSLPRFYAAAGVNGRSAYPTDMAGGKGLAVGAPGSLYAIGGEPSSLNYADDIYELTFGSVTMPNAQYLGASVTAPANVVDNALTCSTAATLSIASSNAAEFTGTAGTTCTSIAVGGGTFGTAINSKSSYPATITFNPVNPSTQTATLTVSDTTNGGLGTATVTGLAQTTPQTVSFTAPTTTTYTYAAPPNQVTIALTLANGGSNFPASFSIDKSSTGTGTLSAATVTGTNTTATLTVTQAGTITIDASEPAGLSNGVYYSVSNTAQLVLTINPAAQTVTFTQVSPATYTYAAAPNQVTIQLSATGGASGNAVEFSVDPTSTGTATISASTLVGSASLATLTVTGAGSIVLDASQAASTDYAAASSTDVETFTINQASQTITFIPPAQAIYYIAGGITVPIAATGGGSDNAIVFTVDKSSTMTATVSASTVSGATSTAMLTIPNQTTTSGTIVLDATQPQNTNYSAASATPLVTLTIGAPLPTQTITFNNPGTQVVGTPATLSASASSTLPLTFTSSTTSVCTVVGATVTFATSITTASTCTIVTSQPGDNVNWAAAPSVTQNFTVNPTGQDPSISLNLSLSALTIAPGTTGLTQLTITSLNNFNGAVALTCSGLPSGYTCSFNPNPISIAAGSAASTTLSVTPPATTAMNRNNSRPLIPFAALAVAFCFIGFRKRTRLQLLVILALGLAALGGLSACGGSASTTQTKATTSTATITVAASGQSGASSQVKQTTTLTVTVE